MTSKFLNISTDNTLGGSSSSDEVVSSQKAVKDYVDEHGGGSSYTAGTGIDITSDVISVTSAISDGAAAGSTALQPADVAEYTANEVETLWESL